MNVEQLTSTLGKFLFYCTYKTKFRLDESVSLDNTQEDVENNVTIITDDANKENRLADMMKTPARGFDLLCAVSN